MKILVVHRQKDTVNLIKSVLGGRNPVVLQTESGLDGLLTSRIEHFDLIICGTDLPVVTGFELVRSIRTNSINRHTAVIFLATSINDKMEHLSDALGALALLTMEDVEDRLANEQEYFLFSFSQFSMLKNGPLPRLLLLDIFA